jgi:putative PIN family toxin of toxin-antitoxin system
VCAVIIDTNVFVAGLLTGSPASPVARILDGMLAAAWPFVVSDALLAEYHSVLLRAPIRRLHGLAPSEVEALLLELAQRVIVLTPAPARPAPDPGDQLLWGLLAARADVVLITGDKRLLRDAAMKGRVVAPAQFVASLAD